MTGLLPLYVVAEFLGKRVEDMTAVIKEDLLPAIKVPSATRQSYKVSLLGLQKWLAGRTEGEPLTVDDLSKELDRCQEAVDARMRRKRKRGGKGHGNKDSENQ